MQQPPKTQYAWEGAAHVAFQQFGSGGADVVLVHEWMSHQEVRWELPELARFLGRFAAFARVLTFDKRGCGLSDPVTVGALPTLEEWTDDVIAVLDAAGVERATLIGIGAGGPMTMLAAASHPDRVDALVLVNRPRACCALPTTRTGSPNGWPRRSWPTCAARRRPAPGTRRPATRLSSASGGRATASCGNGWRATGACRSAPPHGWRPTGSSSRPTSAARLRRSECRRWCCTGATARGRVSATVATWLSTSPARGWSSSPETSTFRISATSTRWSARSRSS